MISVFLPDQTKFALADGASVLDLAASIGPGLARAALTAKVNGTMVDLSTALQDGDQVEILTFDQPEGRDLFWHSSAHVLAQAVKRLFPDAQPTIGPPVENGFYYDFADLSVTEEDLEAIEQEARNIIKENQVPERIEYDSAEEALAVFGDNPFKRELVETLEDGLSAYRQGEFVDLCRGPHLPNIGKIKAFKVLKTSGAYWRGDSSNPQLTRIYAVSFPDKKMMKEHLKRLEEALKRDHRVLGKQLKLFSFHKEGPGMAFIHPRGMVIWRELLNFWHELHAQAGYQEIKTPVMLSRELWERSGHWENYRENMYTSEIENRIFAIKPMNCPGGMMLFKEQQYSYRDLPARIGEIGLVHRHEMSGALSGMFRVRSFHQDDAHIYMTPDHIKSEIIGVLTLAEKIYSQFSLEYHMELSTKPEKHIGTDADWEMTTAGLKSALDAYGQPYVINEGDGAFYGPKIDFHIRDAIGRTWQCGTIQLDMSLPERFDLSYITEAGTRERPIMIHRALYGSIERFFGILVEHYAGKFPVWLSPVQVRLVPVAERHHAHAMQWKDVLDQAGLRSECDVSNESVNKKVRNAQLDQVNYILVIGDKELEQPILNVRTRDNQVHQGIALDVFVDMVRKEYRERSGTSPLVSERDPS